jgi:DNA-binding response OmpR family regulator
VTATSTDRPPTWAGRRARFLLVIADPDETAARELGDELARHHVDTEVCTETADALLAAGTMRPDAVLLAAEQPGLPTAEIVRALGRRVGVPVVVGIGEAGGDAAAAALAAGATACIARPYRVPELIPIMRAIRPESIGTLEPPLVRGNLILDPATLEVRLNNEVIPLPLREYRLLRFLMENADRVVTRDQIYGAIWAGNSTDASNTLAVHIKRLRERLGDDSKNPQIIYTVRGVGYRLNPPGQDTRNGIPTVAAPDDAAVG